MDNKEYRKKLAGFRVIVKAGELWRSHNNDTGWKTTIDLVNSWKTQQAKAVAVALEVNPSLIEAYNRLDSIDRNDYLALPYKKHIAPKQAIIRLADRIAKLVAPKCSGVCWDSAITGKDLTDETESEEDYMLGEKK